jgi:hypothetical protein
MWCLANGIIFKSAFLPTSDKRLGGTPCKGVVETSQCPGRRALGRRPRAAGSALDLPNLRSVGNQIEQPITRQLGFDRVVHLNLCWPRPGVVTPEAFSKIAPASVRVGDSHNG